MTRPPLSERRRTHTRREIAESAVTLFARDGYDNVSVEDISEEAGISLLSFYRHFSANAAALSPLLPPPPRRPRFPPTWRPPLAHLTAHRKRLVSEPPRPASVPIDDVRRAVDDRAGPFSGTRTCAGRCGRDGAAAQPLPRTWHAA